MNYSELKVSNRKKIQEYTCNSIGKVDFFPAYIQIEQTNRCNAQCIMCNHFYMGNRGASDISEQVMCKLEPIFPYCETVMLNGDGEPFLNRNIVKNIKTLSSYGVEIGTNTNLSYIPNELFEYLNSCFKFLNISCDGATAKTYEMIRKGLFYETFIDNLKRLNKEAPNLKKNIDCVVMKQNVAELSSIVELAAEYGISCVKFQRLGINPCIENQTDAPTLYYQVLAKSLNKAIETGKKCGVEVKYPQFKQVENRLLNESIFEQEIEQRYSKTKSLYGQLSLENDYFSEKVTSDDFRVDTWQAEKICQWALERCYIDLKGNVTTCCFNMKKYMGSLMMNSFEEVWNGEEYRALRAMMSEKKLPGFCRQCNWIKDSRF